MAILTDPLFSEEARGQIAKVAVFKRAAVHPVFCAYSYHRVNWSASKLAQAHSWKSLCDQWRALDDDDQDYWRDKATGVLTGFNYFMQCKGVPEFASCYSPPSGDALDFDFIDDTYDPPAGDSLFFNWEECI